MSSCMQLKLAFKYKNVKAPPKIPGTSYLDVHLRLYYVGGKDLPLPFIPL